MSEDDRVSAQVSEGRQIRAMPLTEEGFAPFGDVLEASGPPDEISSRGRCGRYNDRAELEFTKGFAGISLALAEVREMPYQLNMVERFPMGTQALIPMTQHPYLICVAKDNDGTPETPIAFIAGPGQAINLRRGIWQGVLTPLAGPGLFAVVERIGAGRNHEEFWFDRPYFALPPAY